MSDWIEHDGGPCPVPDRQRVAIKLRDGSVHLPTLFILWIWHHDSSLLEPCDHIIAYRPEEQP